MAQSQIKGMILSGSNWYTWPPCYYMQSSTGKRVKEFEALAFKRIVQSLDWENGIYKKEYISIE